MGWRLAEAVLEDCPDIPYREFRVLMAFVLDARDATCEGLPGMELLARRGHCSERTARRVLASLIKRGLVENTVRAAPGRRAVYRLRPMPGSPAERGTTVLAHDASGEPVDNSADVGQMATERGPNPGQRGPQPLAPPLSHPPVTTPLSSLNEALVNGSLESAPEPEARDRNGGAGSRDGHQPDLATRRGTEQARMALADKLTEWLRTHDPETGQPLEAAP